MSKALMIILQLVAALAVTLYECAKRPRPRFHRKIETEEEKAKRFDDEAW